MAAEADHRETHTSDARDPAMFAVIKTGGKQYKVAKDDIILVERLPGDAGAAVSLDEVLMVGNGKEQTVGAPLVSGASVAATILDQPRGDKIIVFKKNRRKNYRRRAGHRQDLTVLRITDILASGKKAAKATAKAETPAPAKSESAKGKPAASKAATKPAAKKAPAKKTAAKKAPTKKPATKAKAASAGKTAAKKTAATKATSGKTKKGKE